VFALATSIIIVASSSPCGLYRYHSPVIIVPVLKSIMFFQCRFAEGIVAGSLYDGDHWVAGRSAQYTVVKAITLHPRSLAKPVVLSTSLPEYTTDDLRPIFGTLSAISNTSVTREVRLFWLLAELHRIGEIRPSIFPGGWIVFNPGAYWKPFARIGPHNTRQTFLQIFRRFTAIEWVLVPRHWVFPEFPESTVAPPKAYNKVEAITRAGWQIPEQSIRTTNQDLNQIWLRRSQVGCSTCWLNKAKKVFLNRFPIKCAHLCYFVAPKPMRGVWKV